jgi:DNA modification methylase
VLVTVGEHVPITTHCGNAATILATLEPERVQCIVTSPPYFWQRDYGIEGQIGHEPTIDGYVAALAAVFHEAKRVLRREGVLFLNIGDTYYSAKGQPHGNDARQSRRRFSRTVLRAVDGPGLGVPRKSLIGIPWRVALALQADGWTLRADVLWRKTAPQPEPSARDRPWTTVEHVFVFARSPKYYFDRGSLGGEEDVWVIPAPAQNKGIAPFPDALVTRCIACGSRPGDLVLDPFAGSGTTLRVAEAMGRSSLGIDLQPILV